MLKRLRLREQRRQSLQKFAQKAPQPPALKPPSTARTAGRSDWTERRFRRQPFILLSFSSSEKPQKRRKRSHTNVSNALVTRPSAPPAQTPQRLFQGAAAGTHATPSPNRAHSGSHAETRRVLRVDGDDVSGSGIIDTIDPFQADQTVAVALAEGHRNAVSP